MLTLQPFSRKSRTPTVAKEFKIGLYDPAEADLEHFWPGSSARISILSQSIGDSAYGTDVCKYKYIFVYIDI